ncbi:hypothetical protein BY996DRAFT_6423189 [Phakopsora pachyrhizi]|nr:hypothetical protein BY996DRAFT_6423189 [Phakopsora pachyrhizi]
MTTGECISKPLGLLVPANDLTSPDIKYPFDLWQGEHTIVTEDKPKAEVNNFKDDYNNETDEDGEPVQIPTVKPLCAVAHIDLNNTVEDDPINIVIKIENLTATFIVSSGSGGENKVEGLSGNLYKGIVLNNRAPLRS